MLNIHHSASIGPYADDFNRFRAARLTAAATRLLALRFAWGATGMALLLSLNEVIPVFSLGGGL